MIDVNDAHVRGREKERRRTIAPEHGTAVIESLECVCQRPFLVGLQGQQIFSAAVRGCRKGLRPSEVESNYSYRSRSLTRFNYDWRPIETWNYYGFTLVAVAITTTTWRLRTITNELRRRRERRRRGRRKIDRCWLLTSDLRKIT